MHTSNNNQSIFERNVRKALEMAAQGKIVRIIWDFDSVWTNECWWMCFRDKARKLFIAQFQKKYAEMFDKKNEDHKDVLEDYLEKMKGIFENSTNASMNSITDDATDSFGISVDARLDVQDQYDIWPTRQDIIELARNTKAEKWANRVSQALNRSNVKQMIASQGINTFIDNFHRSYIKDRRSNIAIFDHQDRLIGFEPTLLSKSGGKVELLKAYAAQGFFEGVDAVLVIGDGGLKSDLGVILELQNIVPHAVCSGVCWQMTAEEGTRESVIKAAKEHGVPVVFTKEDLKNLGFWFSAK